MKIDANQATMIFDGVSVPAGSVLSEFGSIPARATLAPTAYTGTLSVGFAENEFYKIIKPKSPMLTIETASGESLPISISYSEDRTAPRRLKSRKRRLRKKWNKRYPGLVISGRLCQ
jgi:hypothetical protein